MRGTWLSLYPRDDLAADAGVPAQGAGFTGVTLAHNVRTPDEVTETLALAVRLFGNMMSGAMILAILLTITPFLFPLVMEALGLLTGLVQAYIFSVLATVYLAAATQAGEAAAPPPPTETPRSP